MKGLEGQRRLLKEVTADINMRGSGIREGNMQDLPLGVISTVCI